MLGNREALMGERACYKASIEKQNIKILICSGTGCVAGGALDIYDMLLKMMKEEDLPCSIKLEKEPHENSVGLKKSGCHGFCEMGPLVKIEPWGYLYIKVKIEDCREIIEKTIKKGECIERLTYKRHNEVYEIQEKIPFYKKQTRVVLEHCGQIDAPQLKNI